MKKSTARTIKYLLCGILVGAGAILPGISGGVLCVVFGIYRPLMEVFVHPKDALRKNLQMYIPVAIGWAAGFLLFANLINLCYEISENRTVWLFIGLIVGTYPSLWKEAGKEKRNKYSILSMILCGSVVGAILLTVRFLPDIQVNVNTFWYLFAGILWGISIVVPGMTSSSILMSLGIYKSMNSGLASLDMSVIIPWVIGMAVAVMLLTRIVNKVFEKYHSYAFHGVFGIVVASTLAITPLSYSGIKDFAISLLFAAIGGIAALLSSKPDGIVK